MEQELDVKALLLSVLACLVNVVIQYYVGMFFR